MSAEATKLEESARKGLRQLERGLQNLPDEASVEIESDTLKADEVVLLVLTKARTFVRRKMISGRHLTSKEIQLRLAGAEAAIDDLVQERDPKLAPQLTTAEAALLDRAGFGVAAESVPSSLERSRIELELLIRTSLTIDEAAHALGVTTSRVRQRLSQRSLYGLKEGKNWRIPRFQFASKSRLVRKIDVVLPHIRGDAHPLVVKNWFTLPHQDLVVGDDEQPVSPIEWLASGGSPEVVAELADEI